MLKRKNKRKISINRIRRWIHKTGEMQAFDMTLAQVEDQAVKAYQDYKEAKKKTSNWRNELLDSLFEFRAEEKGTTTEAEEKLMKHIKRQWRQARNVKRIRKKGQQGSVTMVYETDKYGRHE